MRAKWRKKRVRRLKRKRRKTRARASKRLTTTRSRSLLPLELYHHDNITSEFTPFQITRTVWDYHTVQWQLGVQGQNSLMTRILWHLMDGLQGSRIGHTHCRIVN
ncbi:hypothetical protein N431DRAFT_215428 [Stipitochalara longipes BDJ]|nr:hypothetical protein N431DRAFT_215428 [Stipitochalara longipes BDJ]